MKIVRNMFDIAPNGYCGVYVDLKTMKRIAKIAAKATDEIRATLDSSKDKLLIANWTCATDKNGKGQVIVNYSDEATPWDTIDSRINLFRFGSRNVKYLREVPVCTYEEAQAIAEKRLKAKLEDAS